MLTGALGRAYQDGEEVIRQGEVGDCMYIIQIGQAEVIQRKESKEFCLGVLKEGDFFGEMALFEKVPRPYSVRALGNVWVLTLEKKGFLRRMHEDPSLVMAIMERLCRQVRELNEKLILVGDVGP